MDDQYRALYDAFRWHVPHEFNIAEVCGRRWAQERSRVAIYFEDEHGKAANWIGQLRNCQSRGRFSAADFTCGHPR